MIDLVWFKQFENFKSFFFILKYGDQDVFEFNDLKSCCSFFSYDFADSYAFIADFINCHFFVIDFDFTILKDEMTLKIVVESV